MAGQVRFQMLGHTDRPHPRAAAAVGDAEGFVQIQVADIGADPTRAGQTNLGVHVGAVHVDLAAKAVYDPADLLDLLFKNAVGRRIGYHEAGQSGRVLVRPTPKIFQVDIAVLITGDDNHIKSGHRRARWIGAVSAGGNQGDIAHRLAAIAVVGADDHQTGVFALGARVRLQRDSGESGDLRQVLLQILKDFQITVGLILGSEGVDSGKFRP